MDNHKAFMKTQREHEEITRAVLDFKNGDLTFADFLSFAQSFVPDVTVKELVAALETA